MHIAMTGLTSGIGVQLAEAALARGDAVAGLVRDPARSEARDLEARGVRLVKGDLDDHRALRDLAADAGVLVHLAAHVGDWGSAAQFERVNVGGTRNTVEAGAAEGVRRFIQLSSSAVYGRPDQGRVTEDWPTRHSGRPYEDTKTDAERLAFARGRELGMEVVAVRPPIIYGPHDRNFMPRAIAALRERRFLLVNRGRAPLNLVWVDHVVDVVLLAADKPGIDGEAFNVMDEVSARPPSVLEVATTIAREAGVPPPTISLPYPLAMGIGHVLTTAYSIAGAKDPPPITPFVIKLMTRDVVYDASKAARVLGWKPRCKALEGIAQFAREAAGRSN